MSRLNNAEGVYFLEAGTPVGDAKAHVGDLCDLGFHEVDCVRSAAVGLKM